MGAATARAFAEAGASVAVVDLNGEAAEPFAAELSAEGHRALAVQCDVSDEAQVENAVARTVEAFDREPTWRSAMRESCFRPVDSADETAEAFDKIVVVNLRGVWASMKHELVQMRKQRAGSIVNCSSLGGLVGGSGRATYHATKHGVIGQSKSVALQYAPLGVRVNAVCPRTIQTPMVARMTAGGEPDPEASPASIPVDRLGRPEIAAAVLWLCSDAASYVTGIALPVDGGFTA
jgi:NAD(P)-dependent dehydrogenase (short-subunit alcohol dehydrogenase family)